MSDEEHYATHVVQSIPRDVAEPIKSKRRLKYKQPSDRSLLGLGMLVEKNSTPQPYEEAEAILNACKLKGRWRP